MALNLNKVVLAELATAELSENLTHFISGSFFHTLLPFFFKPLFPDYPGKYSEEESKSSTSGITGDLGDDLQEARAPTIAQLLQEKTLYSFSEWPKVPPGACMLHPEHPQLLNPLH